MKTGANNDLVTLTGKVSALGMTTFQYGTHLIKVENKTYALKSSKVNLDTYIDKSVTLKGTKVSGYPLEGGPDFIEVSEVQLK
jgi:hypothetical protein